MIKKANFKAEDEGKDYVNIVFIGHVDAGKSTMSGQILKLTGMVDQRTLEKYERESKDKNRESWALSWCIDTNDEERDKGKTVEYGKAFFETEKKVSTGLVFQKVPFELSKFKLFELSKILRK